MDSLIKEMEGVSLIKEIKDCVVSEMTYRLEELMEKWNTDHSNGVSGGAMRAARGADIETFVRDCINFIGKNENVNLHAKRGSDDYKLLEIKNGNGVIKKKHQIDVHVYLNDNFVAVIECKSYLEHCMYVRACDDFKIFKKFDYTLKNCIFAMEESINTESKIFTDLVNENICDYSFIMLDGKRSSSKSIYDPRFKKDINKTSIASFIDFIYNLI